MIRGSFIKDQLNNVEEKKVFFFNFRFKEENIFSLQRKTRQENDESSPRTPTKSLPPAKLATFRKIIPKAESEGISLKSASPSPPKKFDYLSGF